MPWVAFALVLLLALLLQTAVLPFLPLVSVFDLMLALALVCGLVAPIHDARLACWVVGFVYGLASIGALGVHALAYGCAGVVLTRLRGELNMHVWWGRAILAFLGAWPSELMIRLHMRFWQLALPDPWWSMVGGATLTALLASLLAAALTARPGLLSARRRQRALGR
jgi:rod shape-determining protein MreD